LRRQPPSHASLALALLVVAVGGGCSFGESGIAPPSNRIFLPAGLAIDRSGEFLYVVNSNSDLRFNAGTVVAVPALGPKDVSAIRALPTTLPCTKTRFSRTEAVSESFCCIDMTDRNVVNCNDPQFIQADATIQIGSFGGPIAVQSFQRNGVDVRRLFVGVRAEPSITYADVTVRDDGDGKKVSMRCTGPHDAGSSVQPKNAFCDDNWRVRRPSGATPGELVLPEEPHSLWLDEASQTLVVGHLTVGANLQILGGGLSSLDVCNPTLETDDAYRVRFAGLSRKTFLPESLSQSVAGLSAPWGGAAPSATSPVVFATARYTPAISGMVFRNPPDDPANPGANDCNPTTARDLSLVPGEHFLSPAFLPNGADVRSIIFSADGKRAFVLHRNDADTMSNPAAIAVLDRRPLPDGTPSNQPITVVQVCNGPSTMQMMDVGRGERLFVTCYDDGWVYVIDPVALVHVGTVDVGVAPIGLTFSPTEKGIAYVASFVNSHLSVIDFRPGSPTENRVILRVGLPHGYSE
jgi:hypothetical protein